MRFFQTWGEDDWELRVGARLLSREAPVVVDVPVLATPLDGTICTGKGARTKW
jgi:hypothetical protein